MPAFNNWSFWTA